MNQVCDKLEQTEAMQMMQFELAMVGVSVFFEISMAEMSFSMRFLKSLWLDQPFEALPILATSISLHLLQGLSVLHVPGISSIYGEHLPLS